MHSWWPLNTYKSFLEFSKGLHHLLDPTELQYIFGTTDKNRINQDEYHLVVLKDVLDHEKAIAKRSGLPPPDKAYSLDIFGKHYNLKLKKTKDLLAPHAKVEFKEGLFLTWWNNFLCVLHNIFRKSHIHCESVKYYKGSWALIHSVRIWRWLLWLRIWWGGQFYHDIMWQLHPAKLSKFVIERNL